MEWLLGLVVIAASFSVGRLTGKGEAPKLRHEVETLDRNRLEAEARYLECLRRDIALALLVENPPLLLAAHETVRRFTREMRDGDKGRLEAERRVLSLRYPLFQDFDLFGLKHFVPVESRDVDPDAAVERYVDIGKFLVCMEADTGLLDLRKDERLDRDREILERVVRRWEDRLLIERTDAAIGRFYAWRQVDQDGSFEDRDFRVEAMPFDYTPEIEFGVTFKADGTRVVYGFYTFDDRPKTLYRYSLADEGWKKLRTLEKS